MREVKTFSDLKVRSFLLDQIMRPVKAGRIVHAQLYVGLKGTGKHTAALLTARAMNCQGMGERPCNECPSCKQFLSGNSPRLLEVAPEKGSIKIEPIRDLIERIYVRPDVGYLCAIIDEADKMTNSAQNAFLKTLEEAPEYAAFFLLTEKPASLLPTIRSRCAMIRFAPLQEDMVREALENMGIPPDTAVVSAKESGGSIGYALRFAESESDQKIRERALQVLLELNRNSDVASASKKLGKEKENADMIMKTYELCAHRLMRARLGVEIADDPVTEKLMKAGVRGELFMSAVIRCEQRFRSNVSYQASLEMLFFDILNQEDR